MDDDYFYKICTLSYNTFGSANPFITLINRADYSYETAIFMNWGQTFYNMDSHTKRIKLVKSMRYGDQLFFGGTTK
jgi:hypothetical protein